MNIRALNELMKLNGISSYFYLAQKIPIPYTTLLDLVKGKGEKLSNIRIIADFFGVKLSYLIEDNDKTFLEIDELNKHIKLCNFIENNTLKMKDNIKEMSQEENNKVKVKNRNRYER